MYSSLWQLSCCNDKVATENVWLLRPKIFILWSYTDNVWQCLQWVTMWISENISLVTVKWNQNEQWVKTKKNKTPYSSRRMLLLTCLQGFPSPMAIFLNIWSLGCFIKCRFLNYYYSSPRQRSELVGSSPVQRSSLLCHLPWWLTAQGPAWPLQLSRSLLCSSHQAGKSRHRRHTLLLKGTNWWSNW